MADDNGELTERFWFPLGFAFFGLVGALLLTPWLLEWLYPAYSVFGPGTP